MYEFNFLFPPHYIKAKSKIASQQDEQTNKIITNVPYKRAVHPKRRPKRPWSDQLDSNVGSKTSPRRTVSPPAAPRIMTSDISRLRIRVASGELVPLR